MAVSEHGNFGAGYGRCDGSSSRANASNFPIARYLCYFRVGGAEGKFGRWVRRGVQGMFAFCKENNFFRAHPDRRLFYGNFTGFFKSMAGCRNGNSTSFPGGYLTLIVYLCNRFVLGLPGDVSFGGNLNMQLYRVLNISSLITF